MITMKELIELFFTLTEEEQTEVITFAQNMVKAKKLSSTSDADHVFSDI